jgi:hypothetical protein
MMNALPSNWKEVLSRCNFSQARREIAEFFKITKLEAQAKGGEYVYKNEFVEKWGKFAENPCYETAVEFLKLPEYAPFVFNYFVECCPGGSFHRTGIVTAKEFLLGEYRLDMCLQDIIGLKELTKEEYAVFGRDSLQDVVYHANPTEFVRHRWKIMVGAIEGKLYELGAILEMKAEEFKPDMVENVFKRCELLLGTPTYETQGRFMWDTSSGRVIFQYAFIADMFEADLFVSNRATDLYGNS